MKCAYETHATIPCHGSVIFTAHDRRGCREVCYAHATWLITGCSIMLAVNQVDGKRGCACEQSVSTTKPKPETVVATSPLYQMTASDGTLVLKTSCVGKCSKNYCIDANHPAFFAVKTALDKGDRGILRCYHEQAKPVA